MGDPAPTLSPAALARLIAAAPPHRATDAFLSGLTAEPARMNRRLATREAEYIDKMSRRPGPMGVVSVAPRFSAFAKFAEAEQAERVIAAARHAAGADNPFVTEVVDRMAAEAAVARLRRAGHLTEAQAEALSFLVAVMRPEAPRPGTEASLTETVRSSEAILRAEAPEVWRIIEAELPLIPTPGAAAVTG